MKLPRTIDSTGRTDVTGALNDWLGSLPDGETAQFPKRGKFKTGGVVEVLDKTDFTVAGNHSTFNSPMTDDPERTSLRLFGGANVAAKNLIIAGPSTGGGTPGAFVETLQWQHGVACWGVDGVTLTDIDVHDVYGDGWYFGLGHDGAPTRDAVVTGGSVVRNGRQGVAAVHVDGLTVQGATLNQISLMTFNVEPNPGCSVTKAAFLDNFVGTGPRQQLLGIVGHGPVKGVTLARNTLTGKPITVWVDSVDDYRVQNVIATDNTSTEPLRSGFVIDATDVDWLTVARNVQPLAGGEFKRIVNCTNVVIQQ